jgi:hypothetical protein
LYLEAEENEENDEDRDPREDPLDEARLPRGVPTVVGRKIEE